MCCVSWQTQRHRMVSRHWCISSWTASRNGFQMSWTSPVNFCMLRRLHEVGNFTKLTSLEMAHNTFFRFFLSLIAVKWYDVDVLQKWTSAKSCKGLDSCYSATYMSQTRDQQRFTISEVAADWHEPMMPQCIMWPSIARANGQLDPRCIQQTHQSATLGLHPIAIATTHFPSRWR